MIQRTDYSSAQRHLPNIDQLLDRLPLTPNSQCSYFLDKLSRSKTFKLEGDIPVELLEIALNKGFRRCGDIYYQFNCENCQLCLNYRVVIGEFCPSRSQRRVLNKNRDVESILKNPVPTVEKEELYLRYQFEQHYGSKACITQKHRSFDYDDQLDTMYHQMYTNPKCSKEIELYANDKLIGFGIVDVAIQSVSAVYFVFDPKYRKRSLGTLAILRGIDWGRSNGFHFYHLGFYIPGHPKMDYKKNFGRSEILDRGSNQWRKDISPSSLVNKELVHCIPRH